jgi:hypothetical protein
VRIYSDVFLGLFIVYTIGLLAMSAIGVASSQNRAIITVLRILIIYRLHNWLKRNNNHIGAFPTDLNSLVWAGCRAALGGKAVVTPGDRTGSSILAVPGSERTELQDLIRPIA